MIKEHSKNQKFAIIRELLKTIFGLFIFAFGVYLTMCADIGLAPWDVLSVGVTNHTPLSYGNVLTIMGILILIIDLLMGEKIGLGTLLDALLVGNFVDMFNSLNIITYKFNIIWAIVVFIIGMFIMALGQLVYMSAAQGCGPRDQMLIGIGKRMRKVPIGLVNILILIVVLISGWLLGGPVGFGTVLATFGIGITLQIVCRIFHFEPRDVEHKDIIKTFKMLLQKRG